MVLIGLYRFLLAGHCYNWGWGVVVVAILDWYEWHGCICCIMMFRNGAEGSGFKFVLRCNSFKFQGPIEGNCPIWATKTCILTTWYSKADKNCYNLVFP